MHTTARLPVPCVPLARTRPAAACQVEQGTSYFFKVQVVEAEFIQLRVFLSMFGDAPQLVALRKGVDAAGPLQCLRQPSEPGAHTALCVYSIRVVSGADVVYRTSKLQQIASKNPLFEPALCLTDLSSTSTPLRVLLILSNVLSGTPTLGLCQPGALRRVAPPLLPGLNRARRIF